MNTSKWISMAAVAAILALSAQAQAAKRTTSRKARRVTGVVNINEAPVKKLMLLPYVGRGRAQAIVKYRSGQKFRQVQDLMKVKGIGKKAFQRIRTHLRVSGPTTIRKVGAAKKRKRVRRKTRR